MLFQNKDIKINTPDGFKSFTGIQVLSKSGQFTIQLNNGIIIKCSPTHRLMTAGGWKKAINLSHSDIILGKDFRSKVFFIDFKEGDFEYYDIVGVEGSQFYANDIISHNCEFLGSSSTLISAAKLRTLVYKSPIQSDEYLKIHEHPVQNNIYCVTVDTARGKEGDYSAFKIFDVTTFPYKDVASYRNREIDPLLYPNIVYRLAMHYNSAMVLVETNDIGQQVADILQHDLEYDNLVFSHSHTSRGVVMSGGFSQQTHAGVRTTKAVKKLGCSNFKTLVESDKLIICDFATINEMYRFVSNGTTYEAEEGNDDLVMCCVLFSWLADQSYFKEIVNSNVRKNLYDDNVQRIEEELAPFGVIDKGIQVEEVPRIVNLDDEQMSFNQWMAS
jgi:hypothetical protein